MSCWLRCDRRSCRLAGERLAKSRAARSDNQPLYAIATVTGTEVTRNAARSKSPRWKMRGSRYEFAAGSHLAGGGVNSSALASTQQHTPSLLENVAVINIGLAALRWSYKAPANRLCITNGRSRRRQ